MFYWFLYWRANSAYFFANNFFMLSLKDVCNIKTTNAAVVTFVVAVAVVVVVLVTVVVVIVVSLFDEVS